MRGITDERIELFSWATFSLNLRGYRRYLKERIRAIFKVLYKN